MGEKGEKKAVLRVDVHGGTGAPCRVHRLCAFSSIEHSSRRCDPHLAGIGRVSAGPEETHEGPASMHTYIHTYKHMMMMPRKFFCLSENAECARKERKTKSKTSYCEFISVASFPPTTATGHGAHFLSTLSGFDRNASSPFLSFFTF